MSFDGRPGERNLQLRPLRRVANLPRKFANKCPNVILVGKITKLDRRRNRYFEVENDVVVRKRVWRIEDVKGR